MLIKPFSYLQQKVVSAPSGIVTTDLLNYYDATSPMPNPGGNPIPDLQGNMDASMYGTTAITTVDGVTAFNIPGNSSSWIGTGSSPTGQTGININNGITLEIWGYFTAFQSQDWFYNLYNLGSGGTQRQMFRNELTIAGYSTGNSGGDHYDRYLNNADVTTLPRTISLNTWTHYVMTYSPGNFGIYLNTSYSGNTVFTAPTTYFGVGRNLYLWLARRDDRATDNVPMAVGEWRFYNKALSQLEVNQNWNATKARYGY